MCSNKKHLQLNTGDQKLADYEIWVAFDEDIIQIDTSIGNNGIGVTQGFISSVEIQPGLLKIYGTDENGIAPDTDINFFNIHWIGIEYGSSKIIFEIKKLENENNETIGTPQGYEAEVTIYKNLW